MIRYMDNHNVMYCAELFENSEATVAQVGDIPFHRLARAILPWLIPPVVVLLLVCVFPILATGLPGLMR